MMRIATYNIHKGRGMDGRVKPARILEVLRELSADVIALQEVLSIEGGGREHDQARYFAEGLGYDHVFGENRRLRGGAYGNVVLSRFRLQPVCNYDLSVAGRERRGCLRTDVDAGRKYLLHLFNIHLGTGFLERRRQARRLAEARLFRSGDLKGPRIVLGDFNEWTRGLVSQFLSAEFQSPDIRAHLRWSKTYPGMFPFMHLDHIYHDGAITLERIHLHRTRKALMASDHLPLIADFAW